MLWSSVKALQDSSLGTKSREGTQAGQLTQSDQRDLLTRYLLSSGSQEKGSVCVCSSLQHLPSRVIAMATAALLPRNWLDIAAAGQERINLLFCFIKLPLS